MDKFIKALLTFIMVSLLVGCVKNIDKITYTKFNDYFSNNEKYTVVDNTDKYDIDIRRYIEAGDGDIQYFYIELDTSDNATKYLNNYYSDYKIKNYKNYSYVKSSKNGYMKVYKVDNVILVAKTSNRKYKSTLNKVLKELGY